MRETEREEVAGGGALAEVVGSWVGWLSCIVLGRLGWEKSHCKAYG